MSNWQIRRSKQKFSDQRAHIWKQRKIHLYIMLHLLWILNFRKDVHICFPLIWTNITTSLCYFLLFILNESDVHWVDNRFVWFIYWQPKKSVILSSVWLTHKLSSLRIYLNNLPEFKIESSKTDLSISISARGKCPRTMLLTWLCFCHLTDDITWSVTWWQWCTRYNP